MIKHTEQRKIEASKTFNTTTAVLDANSLEHLISVLTKQYSNVQLACIREYFTNAYDATVEAGTNKPVEVTLPTLELPNYIVRDYGTGLDEEGVISTFGVFGHSTKRGSNEFNGQLGIGSKSAHAYTDVFTISAFKDGVKVLAISQMNERGVPNITIMESSPTEEPNGVEITIPVQKYDVRDFRGEAASFFRWITYHNTATKPVFINSDESFEKALSTNVIFESEDKSYVILKEAYKNSLFMGNVTYPISLEKLGFSQNNHYSIHVKANIGDVQFTPSRESLEFTSVTTSWLEAMGEHIRETLSSLVEQRIQECETIRDAQSLVSNLDSHFFFTLDNLSYKGQEVPTTLSLYKEGTYQVAWAVEDEQGNITEEIKEVENTLDVLTLTRLHTDRPHRDFTSSTKNFPFKLYHRMWQTTVFFSFDRDDIPTKFLSRLTHYMKENNLNTGVFLGKGNGLDSILDPMWTPDHTLTFAELEALPAPVYNRNTRTGLQKPASKYYRVTGWSYNGVVASEVTPNRKDHPMVVYIPKSWNKKANISLLTQVVDLNKDIALFAVNKPSVKNFVKENPWAITLEEYLTEYLQLHISENSPEWRYFLKDKFDSKWDKSYLTTWINQTSDTFVNKLKELCIDESLANYQAKLIKLSTSDRDMVNLYREGRQRIHNIMSLLEDKDTKDIPYKEVRKLKEDLESQSKALLEKYPLLSHLSSTTPVELISDYMNCSQLVKENN